MNAFRKNLVQRAFNMLDQDKNGAIEMIEFSQRYNAVQHPDVRTGKKTEEQVLSEFMDGFETQHALITGDQSQNDDKITLDEFMEYYNNVSINIDNDAYFDLMISNAWGLEGGNNPAAMPYAGVQKKV
jgi:Ca2+-binding EF-hand superfamily protein